MHPRRLFSSSSQRRPVSAIFIGDLDLPSPAQEEEKEEDQRRQLPSPPSTNSQGSGDGSVRVKSRTAMSSSGGSGSRRGDEDEDDGDHTAKLARIQTYERVHSLSRARNGNGNGVRLSISGSETEREHSIHSDDHSTPPSSAAQSRFNDPSQHEQDGPSTRYTQTPGASGSATRRRHTNMFDTSGDSHRDPLFADALAQAVSAVPATRKSPHRTRNPLPREFRDRRSYDGRSGSVSPEISTKSRYQPPTPERARPSTSVGFSPNRRYEPPSHEYSSRPPSRAYRPHSPEDTHSPIPRPRLDPEPLPPTSSARLLGRASTVRERRAPHNRWASEDFNSPEEDRYPARRPTHDRTPSTGDNTRWRYQNRGGSAESALAAGGRSLIGEGLRAAGITRRRDEDDVYERHTRDDVRREDKSPAVPPTLSFKRDRLGHFSNSSSSAISEVSNDSLSLAMRMDRLSRLGTGGSDGVLEREVVDRSGDWERDHDRDPEPRTPANGLSRYRTTERGIHSSLGPRPATSMGGGDASYLDAAPPRTAPRLRSNRSTPGHLATISSVGSRTYIPPSATIRERERLLPPSSSSTSLGRHTPPSVSNSNTTTEHPTLMMNALRSFESNLARFTPTTPTSSSYNLNSKVVPDCIQSAQTIVHAANALNDALRHHVAHAVEQQIEAEIHGGEGGGEGGERVWRVMEEEFKESLRYSDEIVRTMTAFLLGVGKVLREVAPRNSSGSAGGSERGSVERHSRTVSLSDEALASVGVNGSGGGGRLRSRLSVDGTTSSGGRGSAEGYRDREDERRSGEYSRRSLEDPPLLRRMTPRIEDQPPLSQQRPAPGLYDRAPTSMSISRSGDRLGSSRQPPPPPLLPSSSSNNRSPLPPSSNNRSPLPSSSGHRPPLPLSSAARATSSASGNRLRRPMTAPAPHDYNSPTPLSRNSGERERRFPALAIPPPLSTLPSESLLGRNASSTTRATTTRATPTTRGTPTTNTTTRGITPSSGRKKISTGSTTTLRGGVGFPISVPAPTTQVTPTTVSTATDRHDQDNRRHRPTMSRSQTMVHDRSPPQYESPVELHGGREQRKRTLSTHSTSDMRDGGYEREDYPHDESYPREEEGYSREDQYPREDQYARQESYSREDSYARDDERGYGREVEFGVLDSATQGRFDSTRTRGGRNRASLDGGAGRRGDYAYDDVRRRTLGDTFR